MAVMRRCLSRRIAVLCLTVVACAIGVAAQTYDVLDVQSVRITGDPGQWVRRVSVSAEPETFTCDILVAGAGSGGVAAALRAASRGNSVCLVEETDEVGGQFASVPALDENRFN